MASNNGQAKSTNSGRLGEETPGSHTLRMGYHGPWLN